MLLEGSSVFRNEDPEQSYDRSKVSVESTHTHTHIAYNSVGTYKSKSAITIVPVQAKS